ncbi:hypothetical protein [Paenibacillus abyssi]|uniref:Uncharacterized protein n=1 Tax=Paenibacillus abyssi TaxID=1340531 RepID=A0A917CSK7_9BACL|nr:hypothetical protein [Paenibacillus abyssi]GGF98162.1 hypothetical protein GCM10010916_14240 [Paenibacillus abyssi]
MNNCPQNTSVIFNKLIVNAVEDTSGIFIGTNLAIGWSTYTKSNQGVGSVKNANISKALNIVNDQDMMDMPVEDSKSITMPADGEFQQHCEIAFQSVNALSVSNGSAIDIGENRQYGWSSVHKNNYGTGKNIGSNRLTSIANFIQDNDVIDAPAHLEGQRV